MNVIPEYSGVRVTWCCRADVTLSLSLKTDHSFCLLSYNDLMTITTLDVLTLVISKYDLFIRTSTLC